MKPKIGIADDVLGNVIHLLSVDLANEMTLYVKTRKAHWNVSGESFMELHQLFENHYKKLEFSIDEIAERIGKLGGKSIGTMQEFSELSMIKECPNVYPNSLDMIKELLVDHETVIVKIRQDIDDCLEKYNDAGTTDFLTGLLENHETISWTLRRYLK